MISHFRRTSFAIDDGALAGLLIEPAKTAIVGTAADETDDAVAVMSIAA